MSIDLSIYYDFASPFCYIARAVVERLRRSYDLRVSWLPFEVIDYLPPNGAMPVNPAFVRRGEAARANALADGYGLDLHLRERLLNSNLALCAVEYARDPEAAGSDAVADAVHSALFTAFYRDQRDIGDLATVVDVAGSAGVQSDIVEALRDGRYKARVARSRMGAEALGVVAVPTWLAGGYGVVGIPPLPDFERLLTQASTAPKPLTPAE